RRVGRHRYAVRLQEGGRVLAEDAPVKRRFPDVHDEPGEEPAKNQAARVDSPRFSHSSTPTLSLPVPSRHSFGRNLMNGRMSAYCTFVHVAMSPVSIQSFRFRRIPSHPPLTPLYVFVSESNWSWTSRTRTSAPTCSSSHVTREGPGSGT